MRMAAVAVNALIILGAMLLLWVAVGFTGLLTGFLLLITGAPLAAIGLLGAIQSSC